MHKSFRHLTGAARPLALATLGLAVAAGLALPTGAQASAFQLKEDSAKSMGRAYAGSAAAGGDVSVVANNPAAMTELNGTYFQADVTAINFSATFNGSAHDALGRPISGGNGGDAGTTLPVPAFFIATQVGDRWHIGGGLTVPFGFQTEYDRNWVGRYNALKTKLESLDATLSASYDVTDNFTLGASAIAQRTSAELTSAINFNMVGMGLVQQGVAAGKIPAQMAPALLQQIGALVPPGSDGYARIKGDDWGFGWQVGALWKLSPSDRLALDYHSRIKHKIGGTANFTVPDNVAYLLGTPTVAGLLGGAVPFTHTTGNANLTTPASATASYWHQAEKFGIGMDLSWTQWSVLKQLVVNYANPAQPATVEPFNWRDTWFASIGGDYYVNDRLTLRGGLAVDTTPTRAANRDPRVPDSTRKFVTVGIGYKANDHFEINASYAHIFVNQAHVNGSTSSTGDVLAGNFDDYGNLLSVSAQYKF
ncbi:outer membrane protein transport protein [Fulvimonas sp. R45]|uniref:OmpP1/FadL family transporter n=1 Tax=Fulvimonas sp. R45 TaxID=3045937 RepID=UPI00265F5B90|nr:outer membrane protein transport protein [Fulvimonas sp. R45]MDO1529990.1 outer membrane protein transport protein [Fulvimonas sp. R45]